MRLLDGDEPDESSGRESASSALEKPLCSGRATCRNGRQFAERPGQSGLCLGVTPRCVVAAAHRFGGRRADGVVGLLQVRERSATPGSEPQVRRPRRGGTACRTGSGVAASPAWMSYLSRDGHSRDGRMGVGHSIASWRRAGACVRCRSSKACCGELKMRAKEASGRGRRGRSTHRFARNATVLRICMGVKMSALAEELEARMSGHSRAGGEKKR